MDFFESIFQTLNFNINHCETKAVGRLVREWKNGPPYDWNSSPASPFKELEQNRVYYIREGTATVITHDATVPLRAGNVYLFPSNTIVATRCPDAMNHTYIHFTLNSQFNYFRIFKMAFRYEAQKDTGALFDECCRCFQSKNPMHILLLQARFREIVAPFFDHAEILDRNAVRFFDVLSYIDGHLDKDLSLQELAGIMNLDPIYFSNLFCATFKVPPIQYLHRKKIELAQNLLLNTDLSIKEIAQRCGFEDADYFSRIFRKKTGTSPRQFRNRFFRADQTADLLFPTT